MRKYFVGMLLGGFVLPIWGLSFNQDPNISDSDTDTGFDFNLLDPNRNRKSESESESEILEKLTFGCVSNSILVINEKDEEAKKSAKALKDILKQQKKALHTKQDNLEKSETVYLNYRNYDNKMQKQKFCSPPNNSLKKNLKRSKVNINPFSVINNDDISQKPHKQSVVNPHTSYEKAIEASEKLIITVKKSKHGTQATNNCSLEEDSTCSNKILWEATHTRGQQTTPVLNIGLLSKHSSTSTINFQESTPSTIYRLGKNTNQDSKSLFSPLNHQKNEYVDKPILKLAFKENKPILIQELSKSQNKHSQSPLPKRDEAVLISKKNLLQNMSSRRPSHPSPPIVHQQNSTSAPQHNGVHLLDFLGLLLIIGGLCYFAYLIDDSPTQEDESFFYL